MVSTNCKKYLCCFYSVLLAITGICWIVMSSILLHRLLKYRIFIPGEAIGPFGLFLCLGFVHVLVSWVGWTGASREHSFHIIMFSVLVSLIVIAEIGTGIWSMVVRDEVDIHVADIMDESFDEHLKKGFYKEHWEKLQKELHCCGINGPAGYNKKGEVPIQCFDIVKPLNGTNIVNHEATYKTIQTGCKKPLIRHIKNLLFKLAMYAFCSGIFQCFGIYAYYKFEKTLRKDEKKRKAENRERRISAHSTPHHPPQLPPLPPPQCSTSLHSAPPKPPSPSAPESKPPPPGIHVPPKAPPPPPPKPKK